MVGSGASAPVLPCATALPPLRLLQLEGPALHSKLARLKVLLLNIRRAGTCDVLISFSPTGVRFALLPRSVGPVASKDPSAPASGFGVAWHALPPPCSMDALRSHINFSTPWQGVT